MAIKAKPQKVREPLRSKTVCEQKRLLPQGWTLWAPEHARNFDVGVDEKVRFKGQPTACIESVERGEESILWLYQNMDAGGYRRKRVRWTGYIKTEDAAGQAVYWLDILGASNSRLAMDNMADRPITGTTDWTKCVLVVDVPEEALNIRLCCSLTGAGTVWFAGLHFEVVDTSVPKTDTYALGCRGIWLNHPVNIDLSEVEDNMGYAGDGWPGVLPKGWLRWGRPTAGYSMGMDSKVRRVNKNSGTIKSMGAKEDSDFAQFTQKFGAPLYRGKRVRLTGYTKTRAVTGHCGLIMRVLDIYSGDIAGENTYDIGGTGTNDWTKKEIVMDVPERAGVLSIGAALYGGGQMWFDGLMFEEVGLDVPLTLSEHRAEPQNLNFEVTVPGR